MPKPIGRCMSAFALAAAIHAGPAWGATVTGRYDSVASFEAAVNAPLLLEDFSRFTPGTELMSVQFLPGVAVRSNLPSLQAYSDYTLIGQSRPPRGIVYFEIIYSTPRRAVAFDVASFDPATSGPAPLRVLFTDDTWQDFELYPNRASPAPVFFGVTSATPISRILLSEGPGLIEGTTEAIALDNFRVDLPEPVTAIAWIVLLFVISRSRIRGVAYPMHPCAAKLR